jgi:hypothetical protein
MRTVVLLLFFITVVTASADVYRSVDEDGNVVFSDQPSPGAEKLDIQEIQTIETQPLAPPPLPPPPETTFPGYDKIAITSPEQDATIRDNQGNFTVTAALDPQLQTALGHQLMLYMDGKPVSEGGAATTFSLQNIDRGTHSLQAVAVDRDGNEVGRSAAVVVHMKRAFITPPAPAPR